MPVELRETKVDEITLEDAGNDVEAAGDWPSLTGKWRDRRV